MQTPKLKPTDTIWRPWNLVRDFMKRVPSDCIVGLQCDVCNYGSGAHASLVICKYCSKIIRGADVNSMDKIIERLDKHQATLAIARSDAMRAFTWLLLRKKYTLHYTPISQTWHCTICNKIASQMYKHVYPKHSWCLLCGTCISDIKNLIYNASGVIWAVNHLHIHKDIVPMIALTYVNIFQI